MPSASLWAAVPHYIPVSPNPKAALALLSRLGAPARHALRHDEARTGRGPVRARRSPRRLGRREDQPRYVRELERRTDAGEEPLRDLPTGDELAAELQKFLSDRGRDPGESEPE